MKIENEIEYLVDPASDADFLDKAIQLLDEQGFVAIEGLFSEAICNSAFKELKSAHKKIVAKFSEETLVERNEYPMVRLPFEFSSLFYEFLESDEIEALVTQIIGSDAIIRNFSGQFVFTNCQHDEKLDVYTWFHRNFRHIENWPGRILDFFIPLCDLHENSGAVLVVPGSHKWKHIPDKDKLEADTVMITLPQGSAFIIDGMLWHREKTNISNDDLGSITFQFCPPVIKQHIDYPRALGTSEFENMSERCRRYLGWYSRTPSNLDEYYKPLAKRTYQSSIPSANQS